jgi:hypothetical protein
LPLLDEDVGHVIPDPFFLLPVIDEDVGHVLSRLFVLHQRADRLFSPARLQGPAGEGDEQVKFTLDYYSKDRKAVW